MSLNSTSRCAASTYVEKVANANWAEVEARLVALSTSVANITDYGAIGDGVHDDTLAVVAAMAAVAAGGGPMYVPQGIWKLTDNVTVPANVKLTVEDGGTFTIASGKTLTINGLLVAGSYQIFSGAGSVTIAAVNEILATWFGAAAGAASAVNTAAIQKSFDALTNGGSWKLSPGAYNSDTGIVLASKSYVSLLFQGVLVPQACSGISFDTLLWSRIENYSAIRSVRSWADDNFGVQLKKCKGCYLSTGTYGIGNFKKGILLTSSDDVGCTINEIHLGDIVDNETGIYGEALTTDSFITEISIFGGYVRLIGATKTATSGSYGVQLVNSSVHPFDDIRIYNTAFEMLHNGINFGLACFSLISDIRMESVDANWLQNPGAGCTWIAGSPQITAAMLAGIGTSGFGLTILGCVNHASYSSYPGIVTDALYGGLTFMWPYNPERCTYFTPNIAGGVPLTLVDSYGTTSLNGKLVGQSQKINKGYEAAAAPTTSGGGVYQSGAVIWNTNRVSGQPMGWVCSDAGTAGTLDGVTGSISAAGTQLTVAFGGTSSINDLYPGANLIITGGGNTEGFTVIRKVDATHVIVDPAPANSYVGGAVAYYNPTWIAMPNYP